MKPTSMKLFTPGPVMVHADVLAAMSGQPLHHRSEDFLTLSQRVWDNLATVFDAPLVAILPGSGMTGLEASMASLHAAGDKILVLDHGRFGDRLRTIAEIYDLHPISITTEWGSSISADQVASTLEQHKDCRGLWFVHTETSTGVTLDAAAIAAAARAVVPDIIIGMDAVTSLGVQEMRQTAWGLDAVTAGLQKGLRCPPGLACIGLSARAESIVTRLSRRTYTMDLNTIIENQRKGLFTWTPPTSLVASLDVALAMLLRDGLEGRWAHHAELALLLRTEITKAGLHLFGEANSHAVVVVATDQADLIRSGLRRSHDFVVAGGQDRLAGKVLRIGTMGDINRTDISALLSALTDIAAHLFEN